MSIKTARKKLDVAHQEVRDEIESEKAKKEKDRLARIERHNQEVERKMEARRKPQRLREVIRSALGLTDPPENTGQNESQNTGQ